MSKSEKEISIKIEGKEWQDKIDKAFIKANKKAKIDGFRPGKAPREIFIKKYGEESLWYDAADEAINDAYVKMLDENKDLQIVAEPKVSLKAITKDYVEFGFTLTLKPELKLGKYKDLGVKKDTVKVTKKEIEEAVNEMRNRYKENLPKEGKLEKSDIAIIDFEGFKDDVAFEGGKGENYSLEIGSNTFIPGFEEKLIGMEKGEERSIDLTFPEDYHSEDLKGKDVVFKVKLNDIKKVVIPELNEEFFEDLDMEGVKSKEELEKHLESTIKARKEMEADNKYIDELLEAAAKDVKVEIPEAMIDDEAHRMVHQYEDTLKMQGLTLQQFYQYTNSDEEALKAQMKDEAERRVKYRLMLEEIIKAEKIEITDEMAHEEANKEATKYGMKEEEFLKAFGGLDMIKYDLEMRKAIDVLKGE